MDDRELSTLLTDAVADVEPTDRLAEIRAAVAPAPRRFGWYAAGGAVLAAAATVTAFAVVGDPGSRGTEPGPGTTPTPTTSETHAPDPGGPATPVYYLGETSRGTRLFREFARFGPGDPGQRALAGLQSTPDDPDYRTLWTDTWLADSVSDPEAGIVVVVVHPDARSRPAGMTRLEAELSIQQVVYTLQAVFDDPALAVQFRTESNPIDQVLGVPTSEALVNGPPLDVLSHVSISAPSEGQVLQQGSTLEVAGVANSFEANVVWRLQRAGGTVVVAQGNFTADGYMGEKLFPFEGEIDLADVPAGVYLLMLTTDDPSGEGRFFTDTRTVVVQ